MEPTPRLFRGLLLLFLIAPLIGWVLPNTVPEVLLIEDRKITEEFGKSFVADLSPPFAIVVSFGSVIALLSYLAASVISLAGLFVFRWWARRLALIVMLVPCLGAPFMNYVLVSGVDWTLFYLEATLSGLILSMAYFSPLNLRFVRNDR